MRVLKFGGSSVGTPELMSQVADIIADSRRGARPLAVAVSAMHGVTNELIAIAEAAQKQTDYAPTLELLLARHLTAVDRTIPTHPPHANSIRDETIRTLNTLHKELVALLSGIKLLGECSPKTRDRIVSFGERYSTTILTATLQARGFPAEFVDATHIIKVHGPTENTRVNFKLTNQLIKAVLADQQITYIVTGFIAANEQGQVTTLGRGGTDYTASILAAALDATLLEIWTDVDGVMTSDPRRVHRAFVLEKLSYQEALELCHFGAKVIYPPTLQPAMQKGIPIRILNTFQPNKPGTTISEDPCDIAQPVTGISSMDGIALLQVQGSGLIGVAGIAKRLFSALAQSQINVILITQASSEHTICVAINQSAVAEAQAALANEFHLEHQAGLIDPLVTESNLAIVSIIGERMRERVGISAQVFGSLGRNGINIRAIAQGSSERNISVVVSRENENKALNALHEEFFAEVMKRSHLFVIGTGLIGQELLAQIAEHRQALMEQHSIDLRLIGLSNSRACIHETNGLDIAEAYNLLQNQGSAIELPKLVERIVNLKLPNTIVVDCTASEAVALTYEQFLAHHIAVVTPNKKAQSDSQVYFESLRSTARTKDVPFLYETSVGAGLPVISTLHDLRKSGDKIISIEAVLSGTLSFIFNSWDGTKTFSQVVREAQALGYTEPDPRDDLNGLDVARKILILARECDAKIELSDVNLQNLVPKECQTSGSIEDFFRILAEHDAQLESQRKQAAQSNQKLCYIASFSNATAQAKLTAIGTDHAFYGLSGSDNIISFTTERYNVRPLVIKGPGAGAAVTAAGVLADIIRISRPLVN